MIMVVPFVALIFLSEYFFHSQNVKCPAFLRGISSCAGNSLDYFHGLDAKLGMLEYGICGGESDSGGSPIFSRFMRTLSSS